MNDSLIVQLVKLGFSEYEAKAYVALLQKSPVSGYELAKTSGVPRSMIYEVAGKLTARGAAMKLPKEGTSKYTAVSATEFLDQLHHEHEALTTSLKENLASLTNAPELDYVWNIEGHDNIIAKAIEMIDQAGSQIYIALLPITFSALQPALEKAIERGVRVVIYTTAVLELPGGQVVVAHVSEETLGQARGLGLILVIDSQEVLIGEWLTEARAWASWTRNSLFVFVAEHHLRTDLYLPQILAQLGDDALNIIHDEDRELFSRALESHIG